MAKPNFNLSGVLGNTKSTDTHTNLKDNQKPKPDEATEVKKQFKKCLLNIPIELHKPLKKYCTDEDMLVTEFILEAIEEKLQK